MEAKESYVDLIFLINRENSSTLEFEIYKYI